MARLEKLKEIFKCKFCEVLVINPIEPNDANEATTNYQAIHESIDPKDERSSFKPSIDSHSRFSNNIIEENFLLENPILLPCGKSICQKHSTSISLIPCLFCEEYHSQPKRGFPSNEALQEMLTLEVNKLSFNSQIITKCNKQLDEVKVFDNALELMEQDPKNLIYEHFSKLKNKVDLRYEFLLGELKSSYASTISKIEEAESNCLIRTCGNNNPKIFELRSLELKQKLNQLTKSLDTFRIDESKFVSAHLEIVDLKSKFKLLTDEFNDYLLDNTAFDFQYGNFDMKSNFGSFICEKMSKEVAYEGILKKLVKTNKEFEGVVNNNKKSEKINSFPNSVILTDQLRQSLITVCKFNEKHNWELVYRASRDGFLGKDFHSKCDNVSKTVTLIKTTANYIFGGYTDKSWPEEGYARDANAFIFSLANTDGKPVRIKCTNPDTAICSEPNHGPLFGLKRTPGHDICIRENSNINLKSFSELGNSYKSHEKFILAGSKHFKVQEIEVYCKVGWNKMS